jgi:hypothetical protein
VALGVAQAGAVGDRRRHRRVQEALAEAGAVKARAGRDEIDLAEQGGELARRRPRRVRG